MKAAKNATGLFLSVNIQAKLQKFIRDDFPYFLLALL